MDVRSGHPPDNLTICAKAEGQSLQRFTGMKANDPEGTGMLMDAIRMFVSENETNAANMPKSVSAFPHSSRYLGIETEAEVCQIPASLTNHQPQTWLMLRALAETGECHLQLRE